MSYTVILSPKVKKFIKKLASRDIKLVTDALKGLEADPFAGDVKKIHGYPYHRKRAGDYRIIYKIDGV